MGGELAGAEGRLDSLVARHVAAHGAPGVAAGVVVGDDLAWAAGHGFAELEGASPVDADTLFRVGSITKTLTGTAIVQLRDQGLLRLDDPLVAHVPEFAGATNPWGPIEEVTLRRLLTHEAGLPVEAPTLDWRAGTFPTIDEVVAALDRVELALAPDAGAKYSNLGYQLLGEVVARVAGRPYRSQVREALLDPLGMRRSGFEGELPGEAPRASGHYPRTFTDAPPVSPTRMKGTDAEGGLVSSVRDLACWASAQFRTDAAERRGDRVLVGTSLAEMHRPRRIVDAAWTEAQGLAWYCTRTDHGVVVGHAGGTFGFRSRLVFDPRTRVAAIALANGEGPAGTLALELLEVAADAVEAHAVPVPSVPVPVPEAYVELLGLYAWEDLGEPARVVWREGRLALAWSPDDLQTLEPTEAPLEFVVRGGSESGERCAFRRGVDGTVTGLQISGWPLVRLLPAE
ncbi:MAG: serine hydrolase domain-containing protein [Actinomycetota bacterium]